MRDAIIIAIISGAGLGLLTWLAARMRDSRDRSKVLEWLQSNTRDEPGESHIDTVTLAKGAGLSDERARHACMTEKRIYRASGDADLWSVWRQEPQSIYEKRGLLGIEPIDSW